MSVGMRRSNLIVNSFFINFEPLKVMVLGISSLLVISFEFLKLKVGYPDFLRFGSYLLLWVKAEKNFHTLI